MNSKQEAFAKRCKVEWNADRELQEEFFDFEAYLHYRIAKEKNLVKELKR